MLKPTGELQALPLPVLDPKTGVEMAAAAVEQPAVAFERSLLTLFQSGFGCVMGTRNAVELCQLDIVGRRPPDAFPILGTAAATASGRGKDDSQYGVTYVAVTEEEFDAMPASVWMEDGRSVCFGIQVHHRRWGDGVTILKVCIPIVPGVPPTDAVVGEVCQRLLLDSPDCGRLEETITKAVLPGAH